MNSPETSTTTQFTAHHDLHAVSGAHDEEHGAHSHPRHHNHPAVEPPGSSGRKLLSLIAGIVFIAILLFLGIAPRLKQQKKLMAQAATVRETLVPVNTVSPIFAANASDLLLPGSVQAVEETTVNARTSGYLRRRYVDIGSRVRKGQLLAEIEAPEVDQQLLQARAETSKTIAGGEQAQADVARLQANVAATQSEVARAQSNLETVRAEVAHTNAKLLEAQSAGEEAKAKLTQTRKKLNGRKADLDRAKTRLALAEKTWKRWQELAKGGAVSGQELDETQANYESSQSVVAGAQADMESAQADVEAAQEAVHTRGSDIVAAQADVAAAQQKIAAAQSVIASARSTVMATQASVEASRANARAAQAGVTSSQANVARVAAMKGFEQVLAPFDGVITARNVDTGALINAGSGSGLSDPNSTVPRSGLFGIARTDTLRIQVQVPQTAVTGIHAGQSARVLIQEFPGKVFAGRVARTAGALDATNRTLLAEVHVPNPNNVLMPGMYAQIQFVTQTRYPLLRVPANTLIIDGDGTRIATVTTGGKVHFVTVQVGRDLGKEVEIRQGLEAEAQLIANPTDDLQEGEPVRVVATSK